MQLIECVPNFSEGRNVDIINQIAESIRSVARVKLLHVDIGYDANRTVMTFAGEAQGVCEAAFRAIKKASELIDMQNHHGEHPRIGATDVCPLIPISGISMDDVVKLSHQLAARVSRELKIPVYCYEKSALAPHKQNLANCRKGEYEFLSQKLLQADWQADFGSSCLNLRSGLSIIGAREILIAYNATLNTEDVTIAKGIAQRIRSRGFFDKEKQKQVNGLAELKAIGWHMPEYHAAQVSMNLTNYQETGMHTVVEEINCQCPKGYSIVGTELIGLVPLKALLDAGRYYAQLETKTDLRESDLIALAVRELSLDFHGEFNPQERIIEYALGTIQ